MSDVPRFLNGTVSVAQAGGYRAGLDAILLAAGVRARPGARVLELGCGAGTALLCAARQNPDVHFTGLEKKADIAALAHDNVGLNEMETQVDILTGDVANPPPELRLDSFNQVFFNPPFFDDPASGRAPKPGKDSAFIADNAKLADWFSCALKRLKSRGYLTVIQRADRLDDIICALDGKAGDIRILPLASHEGAAARRVLVRARKNIKSPLLMLPPLVLHRRGGGYTPEAEAIFLGHAAIDWAAGTSAPAK